MYRRDLLIGLAVSAGLFSCTDDYPRAGLTAVEQARSGYRGPSMVSLISAVNEKKGRSEHSAILIAWDGFRALYDPAGSYWIREMPRRGDINYGVTDRYLAHYLSYHARLGVFVEKYDLVVDEVTVKKVFANARVLGDSSKFLCALAASRALSDAGGVFVAIAPTLSPEKLRRDFAVIDGVVRNETRENDNGQILEQISVEGFDPNDTAPPPKPVFGRGEES